MPSMASSLAGPSSPRLWLRRFARRIIGMMIYPNVILLDLVDLTSPDLQRVSALPSRAALRPYDALGDDRRPLPRRRFGSNSSTAFCQAIISSSNQTLRFGRISRTWKPTCLLHPVQCGAPHRDDLQYLLFVQHASGPALSVVPTSASACFAAIITNFRQSSSLPSPSILLRTWHGRTPCRTAHRFA